MAKIRDRSTQERSDVHAIHKDLAQTFGTGARRNLGKEPKDNGPLSDEEIRDLGYQPTGRGWQPVGVERAAAEDRRSDKPHEGRGPASIEASDVTASSGNPPALAREARILDRFVEDLHTLGVVGEDRNAKLAYLSIVSRFLREYLVSLAIKGLSSSGKSYVIDSTLKFFPPSAYIELTGMSERALIYMEDDFSHRTLVLFEAVALREQGGQREQMETNLTAYFVRSLLSEGRISYPVATRGKDGNFVTKTIRKEGPTNLILSTTATKLHPENETRMLSLPTNDSADQTRAVLREIARRHSAGAPPNFEEWHELQEWLGQAEHGVVVPYAGWLAENIPPVAVRLRRDFSTVLGLIEAHAILHQLSRERDDGGRVIATEDDYLVVRELVEDIVSEGVEATVPPTIRETVGAVEQLDRSEGATVKQVAEALRLDRSAAHRRLKAARERGYVRNVEERRFKPARYRTDDPLPEQQVLLPPRLHAAQREAAKH